MEFANNPEPCMPTPIMPKRTRSLGAMDWGKANSGSGSRKMVLAARLAPAAPAVMPINLRREKCLSLIMISLRLFFQHLNCDFLEEYYVIVAVILQADVAVLRARSTFGLKLKLLWRNRIALGEIGDLYTVQHDNRVRAVQSNFHGVPFRSRFAGSRQWLGERVEHPGNVILVFALRHIIDLDFVAIVHRHPGLARLDGNANEDAGVVIFVSHLIDHADHAVAQFSARPIEQAHATVSTDKAIYYSHFSGPNVLPSGEIFAIEELFPFAGRGRRGRCQRS